jgi:hypothetical protein
MFKRIVTTAIVIAALVSATGCSTLADARSAKGSGVSRTYAAPQDAVWKAIPLVLTELGLPLVSENKTEGYILAQRGITAFSYGENVAIFVETEGGVTKTRVEVISKKALATNFLAPSWENEILNKLDQKLKPKT